MDARVAVVYIFVNMFCMGLSLFLLQKFTRNIGTANEIELFRCMILCDIAFLFTEILRLLAVANYLPLPLSMQSLLRIIGAFILCLFIYFWFWFAQTKFNTPLISSKNAQYISIIPVAILLLLYLLSFRFGIIFSMSPDGSITEGTLYFLPLIILVLYGGFVIVHAISLLSNPSNRFNSFTYMLQISVFLIFLFGLLVNYFIKDTPILSLAICLVLILLFVNAQDSQINTDALTGLPNRRRAMVYLDEQLKKVTANNPCYTFIIDINNFKEINDTLGNVEGDRVLQVVAHSLQATANRYRGLCARWGADEFILILNSNVMKFDVLTINEVKQNIRNASLQSGMDYEIEITAGYSRIATDTVDVFEAIAQAEQMLANERR